MQSASYVRPMTIRQIFEATFALYRRHIYKFVEIHLVFTLFGWVIQTLGRLFHVSVVAMLATIISEVTFLFASAVIVIAASNAVLGRPIKVGSAFRRAGSPSILVKLLLFSIPFTALSMLQLFLAPQFSPAVDTNSISGQQFSRILPIIAFLLKILLLFAAPIAVLEKPNIADSLRRTLRLSWNSAGRNIIRWGIYTLVTFGISRLFYFAVTNLMQNVPMMINSIQDIFIRGLLADLILRIPTILSLLINIFLGPIGSLLILLLYYDARARTENYHHKALAEEMGYQPITEWIPT